MPKLENTRDTIPHLDSAIKSLRNQCLEMKQEREQLEQRVYYVVSEIDAIFRNYAIISTDANLNDFDSSGTSTSQPTSNSSLSLDSIADNAAAAAPLRNKPRSATDVDLCVPNIQESGVCMVPASPLKLIQLASSPGSHQQQNKGLGLELKPLASSSFRIPSNQTLNSYETTRNRSYSQQSLPESIGQSNLLVYSSFSVINKFKTSAATDSITNLLTEDAQSSGKAKLTDKANPNRLLSRLTFSSSSPILNNRDIPSNISPSIKKKYSNTTKTYNPTATTSITATTSVSISTTSVSSATTSVSISTTSVSSASSDDILGMSKTCTEL